jgi:hypothetical protein
MLEFIVSQKWYPTSPTIAQQWVPTMGVVAHCVSEQWVPTIPIGITL